MGAEGEKLDTILILISHSDTLLLNIFPGYPSKPTPASLQGWFKLPSLGVVPGVCTVPQAAFRRQQQCGVHTCAPGPGSKAAPGAGQGLE